MADADETTREMVDGHRRRRHGAVTVSQNGLFISILLIGCTFFNEASTAISGVVTWQRENNKKIFTSSSSDMERLSVLRSEIWKSRDSNSRRRMLLQANGEDGFITVSDNEVVRVEPVAGAIPKHFQFNLSGASLSLTIEVRNTHGGCGLYVLDPTKSGGMGDGVGEEMGGGGMGGAMAGGGGRLVGPGKDRYSWMSDREGSNMEMVFVRPAMEGWYTISLLGRSSTTNLCELSITTSSSTVNVNPLQKDAIAGFFNDCCHGVGACPNIAASGGPALVNACQLPGFSCTPDGNITRLVMDNEGLLCDFPSTLIANLTTLEWIELRNNSISGTVDWPLLARSLRQLSRIDLAYNKIKGGISCDLKTCPLEHVDLGYNQFDGPLPICLLNISGLGVFNVANNSLNGSITDANGTTAVAPSLRRFVISSNQIQGAITETWGTLKNLTVLRVADNLIEGDIPINLWQTNLVVLDISYNMFTGRVPLNVSNATQLQMLAVGHNPHLGGNLPPGLTKLPFLTMLSIENTSISGELPTDWASDIRLRQVVAYRTKMTGRLPSSLLSLPLIKQIQLQENGMYGDLPEIQTKDIAEYGLVSLNLSHNNFSGTFPLSWHLLPMFDKQRNPLEIGESINPYVLDVSFNRLKGPIPTYLYADSVPVWTNLSLQGTDLTCEQSVYDRRSQSIGGVPCAPSTGESESPPGTARASDKPPVTAVVIMCMAGSAVLVVVAAAVGCYWKKRKGRKSALRYGQFEDL